MMVQCEELIRFVASSVGGGSPITYGTHRIQLRQPWRRLPVREAFRRFAPLSMVRALAADRFDELMADCIEPQLGIDRPVFLTDYPAERGALARLKPDDPALAERFELYLGGLELCNGFSELTDPGLQRARFEKENALRMQRGAALYPIPEKFLGSLGSMPAASGNALGVDRLVMLLSDSECIDDVVSFTPEEL
jgi:lysyl-tRNA synthetase class 2